MKDLKFTQIRKDNSFHFETAKKLWVPFIKELNEHKNIILDIDKTIDNLQKRINIQGLRPDMHFEICYYDGYPVGIANFAVDLGGIKGLLEPGYGFIMGFYIAKDFLRKGFGSLFYNHIEQVFLSHGVESIYLTSDQITGLPFWKAMGFYDSGKIDPDDKLSIYIKKII